MSLTHEEWKQMLKKMPMITVDAIVFKDDRILLTRRAHEPYIGFWGVPGGFVEHGETLEEAVKREVKEETGISISVRERIGVYDDPKRDPRGHIISVAFLCEARTSKIIADPKEVLDAGFFDIMPSNILPPHKNIIADGINLHKQSL